jgi:hypothetical protein
MGEQSRETNALPPLNIRIVRKRALPGTWAIASRCCIGATTGKSHGAVRKEGISESETSNA